MALDTALGDYSRNLYWYRHNGFKDGSSSWVAERTLAAPETFSKYRLLTVSPSGAVYAVSGGDLYWFIHDGFADGSPRWRGPNLVHQGPWSGFSSIMASSDGVIYATDAGGELYWFGHPGWQDGSPSAEAPKFIVRGWECYASMFAAAEGVIYGITPDGNLHWHQHKDWQTGGRLITTPDHSVVVGQGGWDLYVSVLAGEDGTIYSVTPEGDLFWHRHEGWQYGASQWTAPESGVIVGNGGWRSFRSVFAARGGVVYGLGVDTTCWMSVIPANHKVTQFTIPGTHDTGTWTLGDGNAKCQTLTLREQLDAGIRFIDARVVQYDNNGVPDFAMYHAGVSLGTWFSKDFAPVCRQFLADHPTETIIMSVKDESGSTDNFEPNLMRYLTDDICFKGVAAPSMAEARGHIVLFRRYEFGSAGIPARKQWPNDDTGSIATPDNSLKVQDVYGYGYPDGNSSSDNVEKKWSFVDGHLGKAFANTNPENWYINFCSASSLPSILDPVDFAHGWSGQEGVNSKLQTYLKAQPKGNFGTVNLDFPEFPDSGDVLKRLILSNLI